MSDPIIIGLVASLIAAAGTYFIAARQFSGKIETSDAAQLWAESRSIRDWSTKRLEELNQLVARLEVQLGTVRTENRALHQRVAELEGEIYARPR